MLAYTSRVLALFVALTIAGSVVATPASKDGPRKETPADTLRKALESGVTLELSEAPLYSAIQQLADMAKVNIIWDRNAVFGSPDEMFVSLKADNVKLRSVLRSVTGQHGLTFGIVGDHILVGSEEVVNYRQLRQRVRLDLDGEALTKVLKDLAQQTGTNIILDPRSQKTADELKVSLNLDDVPLETAVRLMAELGGLKPVRLGNVLFVTSEDRAEKLKTEADAAPREATTQVQPAAPAPMLLPAGPPAAPVMPPPPAMREARFGPPLGPLGQRLATMRGNLRLRLQNALEITFWRFDRAG